MLVHVNIINECKDASMIVIDDSRATNCGIPRELL